MILTRSSKWLLVLSVVALMVLRARLRCLEVDILRMFKVVKSLFFKGLEWLGFGLVERSVKEQSYEGSIWYHVCFNNESSSEITKMSWTRSFPRVMLRIYIHNKPRHARHARPSSTSSMLVTWLTCSSAKRFEQYACYNETAYLWYRSFILLARNSMIYLILNWFLI